MNADLDHFDAADFPPSLTALIRAIGVLATVKFIRRYGGIRVYLPQPGYITPEHPIAQLVGVEAARAIVLHFGEERPYVPRPSKALLRARDRMIRAEYHAGRSASELALKWERHERQIWRILAAEDSPQAPALPAQRGLFQE